MVRLCPFVLRLPRARKSTKDDEFIPSADIVKAPNGDLSHGHCHKEQEAVFMEMMVKNRAGDVGWICVVESGSLVPTSLEAPRLRGPTRDGLRVSEWCAHSMAYISFRAMVFGDASSLMVRLCPSTLRLPEARNSLGDASRWVVRLSPFVLRLPRARNSTKDAEQNPKVFYDGVEEGKVGLQYQRQAAFGLGPGR